MSDPLMQLLAQLPAGEPEPDRAERIRKKCRARLVRRAVPSSNSAIMFTPVWRLFVSVLGAAYLIGAIVEAVRVFGDL